MLVFPLVNDQPANAERVVHHGLGLRGDLDTVTAEGLAALLREVDEDPTFRTRVGWMRERFLAVEESGVGVRRIEEVLVRPRSGRPDPAPTS